MTWPQSYKLFSYSTQLTTKFILLINVKMPTIVGILTFISMINTRLRDLTQETFIFVGILVFMISWNFMLSWVEHEKKFITSGRGVKYISNSVLLTGVLNKTLWCSEGLRGPMSSLESVSLVSVFSGIPWNKYYSIRVYLTSKAVNILMLDGLRVPCWHFNIY